VRKDVDQKEFLAAFERGVTHRELGERYGVTRRTISTWLAAAGVDPQANAKKRWAAKAARDAERARNAELAQGMRVQAMTNLEALAAEYDVKPLTLAHYAERTGHYDARVRYSLRAGRPRRLPARRSGDGTRLAARVEAACAPWEPRTIAGLLGKRDRNFTLV
jgi:transcriptional regulator with XRE-family HTH domain